MKTLSDQAAYLRDSDVVRSQADILASLNRALAEAEECNIATNSESAEPAAVLETHSVEGHSNDEALVGIQHPLPTRPTPSLSTALNPSLTPTQSRQLQAAAAKARASIAGPWRKQWSHQKLARAFMAAEEQGGISFTLNLSARLQATLAKNADPARLLSGYINRALQDATGSWLPYVYRFPYAFIFEVSDAGRLHVHGVIVPAFLHDLDYLRAIDRALGKAGGKLKAAPIVQNTQSHLGTLPDGLGWYAYLQKTGDRAAQFLGTDKVTFISTALRRMCV